MGRKEERTEERGWEWEEGREGGREGEEGREGGGRREEVREEVGRRMNRKGQAIYAPLTFHLQPLTLLQALHHSYPQKGCLAMRVNTSCTSCT